MTSIRAERWCHCVPGPLFCQQRGRKPPERRNVSPHHPAVGERGKEQSLCGALLNLDKKETALHTQGNLSGKKKIQFLTNQQEKLLFNPWAMQFAMTMNVGGRGTWLLIVQQLLINCDFKQITSARGSVSFFAMPGIEPRASFMLHKCSTTELSPQPEV